MNQINDAALVREQYATPQRLNTRISIHSKYSTNKMGFGNWIVSGYTLNPRDRVLELGCGTGDMWKGREDIIGRCSRLVLSDFSPAMVAAARETVGVFPNLEYRTMDIQQIPYDDDSFDVVIANMMLYHVPDIHLALDQVRRVLRPGGRFYCATYGENGIVRYLSRLLSDYGVEDRVNKNFTLQNGEAILKTHFSHVERRDYKDSLAVTDVEDMVEYVYSLSSMTPLAGVPRKTVRDILLANTTQGVLYVPKEYGLFLCKVCH